MLIWKMGTHNYKAGVRGKKIDSPSKLYGNNTRTPMASVFVCPRTRRSHKSQQFRTRLCERHPPISSKAPQSLASIIPGVIAWKSFTT
jgi:hypothetical protein